MIIEKKAQNKRNNKKHTSHLWKLTIKNLKTMFRDKGELAWIFGVPLFFLGIIVIVVGNTTIDIDSMKFNAIDILSPGLIIGGTVVILGQMASHFVEEKEKKTLARLTTTPVKRRNIIFSGMLSELAVAAIQTIFSLLIVLLFGAYIHPNANWLLLFCIPMLFAFTCLGIGVIVASFLKSSSGLFGISFLIILLLIYLGGSLSYGVDIPISDFIPTTYAVHAMRSIMTSGITTWEVIGKDIILLACSGITFTILGILLFQRKTAIH